MNRVTKLWEEVRRKCPNCQSVRAEHLVRIDTLGRRRLLGWRCLDCGFGSGPREIQAKSEKLQVKMSLAMDWQETIDEVRLQASADGMTLSELQSRLLLWWLNERQNNRLPQLPRKAN